MSIESRVCSGLKQITGFRHQVHNVGREAHGDFVVYVIFSGLEKTGGVWMG